MKAKTLIFSLVISFFLTAVVGTYLYAFYQNYFVRNAQNSLQKEAELLQENVANQFRRVTSDLEVISELPPIKGIIRSTEHDGIDPIDGSTLLFWKNRLQVIFAAFLKTNPAYTQIRYISKANHGMELVRVNQLKGDKLEFVRDNALQPKGYEPYFKAWLLPQNQAFYISELTYNRENGLIEVPKTYTIRVLKGIYNKGKAFGFIAINVDYETFLRKILEESLGESSIKNRVSIINESGDTVEYTGNQFKFYLHNNAVISNSSWINDLNLNTLTWGDKGFFRLGNTINYYLKIFVDERVSSKYIYLIITATVPVFFSLNNQLLNNLIVLIACIFLFSFISIFIYSRRLTHPVKTKVSTATSKPSNNSSMSLPTHLPSQNVFFNQLSHEIDQAKAENNVLGALSINIDHFKHIKTIWGSDIGEQLLKTIKERLTKITKQPSIMVSIKEEQFAILLSGFENKLQILKKASSYEHILAEPYQIDDATINMSFSIGVAIYPHHTSSPEFILQSAEYAMQEVQQSGKGGLTIFSKDDSKTIQRGEKIKNALQDLIHEKKLKVHYQLQFYTQSQEIYGVEALLRWPRGHALGDVLPGEFIPIAERTGLIVPLGYFLFEKISEDAKTMLQSIGTRTIHITINLSTSQAEDTQLRTIFETLMRGMGIAPQCIIFDISEQKLMKNHGGNLSKLNSLAKTGVQIALDDFRATDTPLSDITHKAPFSIIKIDQSLTQHIGTRATDEHLIKATITFAHHLGFKVIAEGVETEQQFNFLKENSCDIIQGFYLEKPLAVQTLIKKYGNHPQTKVE